MLKFSILFIALLFLLIPTKSLAADWEIVSAEQNPFDEITHSSTDDEADYILVFRKKGGSKMQVPIKYKNLRPVMTSLNASSPEELKLKPFTAGKSNSVDEGLDAIDILRLKGLHNGEYTPPKAEELYKRAAAALSEMKCPDFSDVDRKTVHEAFAKVFDNKDWLDKLKRDVHLQSNNKKVKLEPAMSSEFKLKPGRGEFMKLQNGTIKRNVSFTDSEKPFDCEEIGPQTQDAQTPAQSGHAE